MWQSNVALHQLTIVKKCRFWEKRFTCLKYFLIHYVRQTKLETYSLKLQWRCLETYSVFPDMESIIIVACQQLWTGCLGENHRHRIMSYYTPMRKIGHDKHWPQNIGFVVWHITSQQKLFLPSWFMHSGLPNRSPLKI